jgi:signal transduction histidine kinase
MDRRTRHRRLRAGSLSDRLDAAREFAAGAVPEDRAALESARRGDVDIWAAQALDAALRRIGDPASDDSVTDETDRDVERLAFDDVYARAVEDTTLTIVHELSRFLGMAELAANREVPNFAESETRAHFRRLSSLMEAIEKLGRVAGTPTFEEFDLAGLIFDIASVEAERFGVRIEQVGPSPIVVVGDRKFVELAIRNGLTNACEGTTELREAEREDIVVTWGETDTDYWLRILDRGAGLPPTLRDPFEFATTSKPDHLGVGLALTSRAIRSLGGHVHLQDRPDGGAAFEIRWPKGTLDG